MKESALQLEVAVSAIPLKPMPSAVLELQSLGDVGDSTVNSKQNHRLPLKGPSISNLANKEQFLINPYQATRLHNNILRLNLT